MSKQPQNKPTKKPDPSRFEIKSDLEDQTGFKVIGCSHVFKYDQYKGWFDEYGNYYNAQGQSAQPGQPPKEQKEEKKEEKKTEETKSADPSRFTDFTLLKDETGFTIKGTEHVFYFDKYGGWYDEYENYYDADGNPATDPEYSEEDDEEDDEADDLARDYADDEDEGDELEHYENLYLNTENQQIIESYKNKDIQIKAWNLPFQTTEDDFEKLLANKKIDFILFEFEYNHRDQFNGYVHLTFDKANAEKFIQLNGEKYNGRNIKIRVEKPKSGDDEDEEEHEEGHEEAHGDDEGEGEGEEEEGGEQDKAPESQ